MILAAKWRITDLWIYQQLMCLLNTVFAKLELKLWNTTETQTAFREPDFQSYRVLHFSEISYRPDRAHSPLKSPSFIQCNRFLRSKKRKKKLLHHVHANNDVRELAYLRSQMRNVGEFIVITQTTKSPGDPDVSIVGLTIPLPKLFCFEAPGCIVQAMPRFVGRLSFTRTRIIQSKIERSQWKARENMY